MESDKAVCMALTSGMQVIGRIVDRTVSTITLVSPYIVAEYSGSVTLRKYNLFSDPELDRVEFFVSGIMSVYQCSETVDHFYEIYLGERAARENDVTIIRPAKDAVEPEDEPEETDGPVVIDMRTRGKLIRDGSNKIDIESIRKSVVRNSSEDTEEQEE